MKKCTTCQAETNDWLVTGIKSKKIFGVHMDLGKDMKSYCRKHVVDEFKARFLASKHKMLVIHPEFEKIKDASLYGYMGAEELKRRKLYGPFVKDVLANTAGSCASCGNPASVAYYGPGKIKREVLEYGNYPDLEHPPGQPSETLCTACAFKKIEDALRGFAGKYEEGLFLPFDEEGLYYSAAV